jgi:hypothetical protein
MTKIEYSYVRQLYKFAIAHDSFFEISKTCEHMMAVEIKSLSPGYYVMAAGIVTLYGRPFTENDLIGRLNPNLVPQKFKELHSILIDLRNQAFAHTDSSGKLQGHGKMTDVRFLFDGKNVTSFSSRPIFEPVLLPQIKELTELLAQKAKESHENYLDRVFKVIAPKFTAADIGKEFELNLQDEKGPMVVVAKDPIQRKYPVVRDLPGSAL